MVFRAQNRYGYIRRASRLPRMAPVAAAYLGGLLDGDGSLWRHKRGYWLASVGNDDPELISACLRLTQAGSVSAYTSSATAYRGGAGHLHLIWTLGRQKEVLDFVRQILPYSVKAHDKIGRLENAVL